MRLFLRITSWGLLVGLIGCSGSNAPLTPVTGRVYYQGQPLMGGTIVFTPDAERGGRGPQAWAEIEMDGRYTLLTKNRPGAVPGWHRVTVAALQSAADPAVPAPPPVKLPTRYRDPELGGQRLEVKTEVSTNYDLHLD